MVGWPWLRTGSEGRDLMPVRQMQEGAHRALEGEDGEGGHRLLLAPLE